MHRWKRRPDIPWVSSYYRLRQMSWRSFFMTLKPNAVEGTWVICLSQVCCVPLRKDWLAQEEPKKKKYNSLLCVCVSPLPWRQTEVCLVRCSGPDPGSVYLEGMNQVNYQVLWWTNRTCLEEGCVQEMVWFLVLCPGRASKRVSIHSGDIHSGHAGLPWCHCDWPLQLYAALVNLIFNCSLGWKALVNKP